MRQGKNKRNKNTVQNVRVVDQYAGADSAYIERCISGLQNSHSQMRALVEIDQYTPSIAAGDISYIVSGAKLRAADDFVSIAAQFAEYRIAGIQFDVYDLTTGVNLAVAVSTYHATSATTPSFTFEQVIDGPDSQLVPAGVGKVSFYWRAKGTLENEFQGILGTDPTPMDFGGLRIVLPQSSTDGAKRLFVVTKALIDFRARY